MTNQQAEIASQETRDYMARKDKLDQLVAEVNRLQNLIAEYPPLEAAEALGKVSFQQFVLGAENAVKQGYCLQCNEKCHSTCNKD